MAPNRRERLAQAIQGYAKAFYNDPDDLDEQEILAVLIADIFDWVSDAGVSARILRDAVRIYRNGVFGTLEALPTALVDDLFAEYGSAPLLQYRRIIGEEGTVLEFDDSSYFITFYFMLRQLGWDPSLRLYMPQRGSQIGRILIRVVTQAYEGRDICIPSRSRRVAFLRCNPASALDVVHTIMARVIQEEQTASEWDTIV